MGRRQGGGSLLDQAQVASTEGLGTGAALGLDQIRTGGHQIDGQLLLLIHRQHVGHGDAQHHVGQQLAGAAGELQHFSRIKDPALGIEGVVVADLHHQRTGLHRRGELLRLHRRHAHGHSTGGLDCQTHQGGVAGHVDQISTATPGGTGDPLHTGGIEIHQASDHLERRALLKAALQRNGQLLKTGHGGLDSDALILTPWGKRTPPPWAGRPGMTACTGAC